MKKLTSLLIALLVFTVSFSASANAMQLFKYESDTPINYISYAKADFEDELGADNTAPSSMLDLSNRESVCSSNIVSLKTTSENFEINGSRFVSFGSDEETIENAAALEFSEDLSSGIVYAEFDVKPNNSSANGYLSLGLLDTSWGSGKTSWFLTLYPDGKITTNGLKGTKAVNRADNNTQLTYDTENWNHFSVELNLNSQMVTVTVNDVKSKFVIMALKPGSLARAGLVLNSTAFEVMIDNIHVYSVADLDTDEETGKSYYYTSDFEEEAIDSVPSSLYGISEFSVTDEAVISSENENKHVLLKSTVRSPFNTRINNGRIVAEFDVKTKESLFALGFVTTDEFEIYNKWLFAFKGNEEKISSFKDSGEISELKENEVIIKNSSEALSFDKNEWQHVTLVIDVDEKKAYIKVGNNVSEWSESISSIENASISGLVLNTDGEVLIDNLEIFKHPNYVKSLSFKGFDGTLCFDTHKVPSVSEMIVLKFSNHIDTIDYSCIELINKTESEAVDFECFVSNEGDTLFIRPTSNGFMELCNYTLTVSKNFADKWSGKMLDDYSVNFYTEKGFLKVLGINFTDDEGKIINNINPGDNIYLTIDYINTGKTSLKTILAYTATDNGCLSDIYATNVTLGEFGKNTYKKAVTVPSDISYDKIKLFLWNQTTRLPVVSAIYLGGM